jgi:hypothetical protein
MPPAAIGHEGALTRTRGVVRYTPRRRLTPAPCATEPLISVSRPRSAGGREAVPADPAAPAMNGPGSASTPSMPSSGMALRRSRVEPLLDSWAGRVASTQGPRRLRQNRQRVHPRRAGGGCRHPDRAPGALRRESGWSFLGRCRITDYGPRLQRRRAEGTTGPAQERRAKDQRAGQASGLGRGRQPSAITGCSGGPGRRGLGGVRCRWAEVPASGKCCRCAC